MRASPGRGGASGGREVRAVDDGVVAETGGGDAGRAPGGRRIAAVLWDAREEARALLHGAQEEARALREGAAAEAGRAREEGREAGRREGLALAAARVARAADEADRLVAGAQEGLLELAAALAGRILDREVRPGADVVALAGKALEALRGRTRATLLACPAEIPVLERERTRPGSALRGARILPEPSLRPGEVVVEAGGARLDARFPALVAELCRALREEEG
ncbi:MAG TPA: hypothetical protein VFM53_00375 [Anaeromyxobacteraceae bacterium]|nr:hypothetical protein [Anaeromyxobacteraceae bacterium]